MAKKVRLDQLLVQRGLAETRARAQALILAGEVRVNGVIRRKAGELVPDDAEIDLIGALPYVSRGGYKLAHALDTFALSPANLIAIDVGASTGGFTDVLLQRGAARVYAVDVGYGLLDWRLRRDPRVVVLERTNIRYLEALPPSEGAESAAPVLADCAVIDVSFISLKLVLPAVQRLIRPNAWIVALIKPQFEAGPTQVGKGGVVRDPAVHAAVLREVLTFSASIGLPPHGLTRSPITGPAGNIEFLAWLGGSGPMIDVERAIEEVVTRT
ncbi:MAG: TlyA family RNA methyltransferase [Roseiflexus sp.]|nr:TlyA family RNA methyltransferase [Roseiflexus sp.]MCS7288913.1 TlyA family RNA methyltransferase [Roseiflexus sp.]MDW8146149.1 TlyA family RNA methyltransferase [Roseiflexaceae bacterium]MDW8234260.1 TlyA family RNA methyltransferase [Roseiflexaceae bacterium]